VSTVVGTRGQRTCRLEGLERLCIEPSPSRPTRGVRNFGTARTLCPLKATTTSLRLFNNWLERLGLGRAWSVAGVEPSLAAQRPSATVAAQPFRYPCGIAVGPSYGSRPAACVFGLWVLETASGVPSSATARRTAPGRGRTGAPSLGAGGGTPTNTGSAPRAAWRYPPLSELGIRNPRSGRRCLMSPWDRS
jgi:hypothetical protein